MTTVYTEGYPTYPGVSSPSPVALFISILICVIVFAAEWKVFAKAGQHGWACLIPIYNVWTLYKVAFGKGSKMFLLLIPIFNIYWLIKTYINLAKSFGKSGAFAAGLIFLGPIFMCILGFDKSEYIPYYDN